MELELLRVLPRLHQLGVKHPELDSPREWLKHKRGKRYHLEGCSELKGFEGVITTSLGEMGRRRFCGRCADQLDQVALRSLAEQGSGLLNILENSTALQVEMPLTRAEIVELTKELERLQFSLSCWQEAGVEPALDKIAQDTQRRVLHKLTYLRQDSTALLRQRTLRTLACEKLVGDLLKKGGLSVRTASGEPSPEAMMAYYWKSTVWEGWDWTETQERVLARTQERRWVETLGSVGVEQVQSLVMSWEEEIRKLIESIDFEKECIVGVRTRHNGFACAQGLDWVAEEFKLYAGEYHQALKFPRLAAEWFKGVARSMGEWDIEVVEIGVDEKVIETAIVLWDPYGDGVLQSLKSAVVAAEQIEG